MNKRVEKLPDHRRRVALLLALQASEETQRILAQSTGRERLAYEIALAWFDDVYVPSNRYLGGLKGDYSPEAAEQFADAFDPVELAAMERFHRFFELRMDMLPSRLLDERRIPIDERWQSLMRDAGYLLEDLGVDVVRLRRRLNDDARSPGSVSDLIRTEA